jgi:hypothetical protein
VQYKGAAVGYQARRDKNIVQCMHKKDGAHSVGGWLREKRKEKQGTRNNQKREPMSVLLMPSRSQPQREEEGGGGGGKASAIASESTHPHKQR